MKSIIFKITFGSMLLMFGTHVLWAQNNPITFNPQGNAGGDLFGIKVTETGNNTTKFHIYRNFTYETTDIDWMVIDAGGKVGLGHSSPTERLSVNGNIRAMTPESNVVYYRFLRAPESNLHIDAATGNDIFLNHYQGNNIKFGPSGNWMMVKNNGNVGIGTTSPDYKLHIKGTPWTGIKIQDVTTSGGRGIQNKYLDGNNDGWTMYFGGHYSGKPLRFAPISQGTQGGVAFTILNGGNVGIGTDTPSNKLDVAGTIRAEEVKVETGWADYVFYEDYNLKSLDEVSTFITKNGHLPNIPTAKEVKENGIKLGEMNAKLLEKIEELTLYLIEMKGIYDSDIQTLKKENQEMSKEIEGLKNITK